jgi:NhaP-type Na+/H+ or K+/H+ antiporter
MDANLVILALSVVVIAAYGLDVVGRKFRLPSVVLLLAAGIALRIVLDQVGFAIPYLDLLLSVLGTVGLVLIVLEGALDLELHRKKAALIARTFAAAAAGFTLSLIAIAYLFRLMYDADWTRSLVTACPFAVISSAVAIPSAATLTPERAEFVVYETSLSDIIGIMVFYALLSAGGDPAAFALTLGGSGAASIVVGVVVGALLYVLINRIAGHVKYLPIIFALMALYAAGKAMHLSPLLLVLAFGLLLNNTFLLRRFEWLSRHEGEDFEVTLAQFKQIVAEGAFVVRTFFFLLLGYSTVLAGLAAPRAWLAGIAVLIAVYATRAPLLALIARADLQPLLWVAPRGLITVVLFLQIPDALRVPGFPVDAVMLIVLASAAILSIGIRTGERARATATPERPDAAR